MEPMAPTLGGAGIAIEGRIVRLGPSDLPLANTSEPLQTGV